MQKRILVANRGEIAVRIIRAARDLGLESVAVYSDADRSSMHVELADYAVCIGPGPSSESYLRGDLLLTVANMTNCGLLHPGYGFLSENPSFAREVSMCGITWVGPNADAIEQMGDKLRARKRVAEVGVPIVPGTGTAGDTLTEIEHLGAKHGYPLILKASAGGGGRGMRIVNDQHSLEGLLVLTQNEALSAFGSGSVYAERYLTDARHIEFQILADGMGEIVDLGERDCSLQRRHQKVLEESPSPAVDECLRQRMAEAARRVAQCVKYVNAGTVEFIVEPETMKFYFIEMNTRLQVEHAVTEEVYGIDLVASQIMIAMGEALDVTQVEKGRGHSIEFRINAEDATHGFRPSPGQLAVFDVPSGPGVRIDSHCRPGVVMTPFYDSLMAKLIVTGSNREEALKRARRSLKEFNIVGVKSNLGMHRALVDEEDIISGNYSTHWLEEWIARESTHSKVLAREG